MLYYNHLQMILIYILTSYIIINMYDNSKINKLLFI